YRLLEQSAKETVILENSHVSIRKKSGGIFSETDAKGTASAVPFIYRVDLPRWNVLFGNTAKQLWEPACSRYRQLD
ncbi:MAG: hypothetical protein J6I30_15710, partial [Pseudomonas sp.]|nr:hypothetical protein [Pseudomonas sp.]